MADILEGQRILVIAPHADDETYGCAGTIAKAKALGAEVYVVVVTVGDLQHYDGRGGITTGATRASELDQVMKYLRVDDYDILYKDPASHLRLDAIPRRDLVALLERDGRLAIDRLKPSMVLLPAVSYNQDHEAVFRAGFTACRPHVPELKPFQRIVLAYDSTSLSWSMERERFHPNVYVDISNYLEHKLKALELHRSQNRPSIHHGSVPSVEYWARVRGREVSVEAAEAYMCLRFLL